MFFWISSIVALAVVFISPILREMDHTNLPVWFRPYLTTQFRSQFPLFPWSAFLMSGTVLGYLFLQAKTEGKESTFIRNLGVGSLAAIVFSLIIEYQPLTFYPNHDFWRASPEFFFVRLGLVCLFAVAFWMYEQRREVSTTSVMSLFGQESLLVYTVHLLVVYGYTYEWSFIRLFGPTLNYFQCFGLFALLTASMYGMAFGWHWMKGWNKRAADVVQFLVLATIVLVFLVKPS